MATIFGADYNSLSHTEQILYLKLAEHLPDYVYVSFNVSVAYSNRSITDLDCVVILPYTAIFILEVHGGQVSINNGETYFTYANGRSQKYRITGLAKSQRYELMHYFSRTLMPEFGIMPKIITLDCWPETTVTSELSKDLYDIGINPQMLLSSNDFTSGDNFLAKLYNIYAYELNRPIFKPGNTILPVNGNQNIDSWGCTVLSDEVIPYVLKSLLGESMHRLRPETPPLLFLSYTSTNKEIANHIVRHIEQKGKIHVFIDQKDIAISKDFEPCLYENIRNCDGVILLISAASQKSEWVKKELLFAQENHKKIFPLKIDTAPMDDFFTEKLSHCQWKTYIAPYDYETDSILDQIAELIWEDHNALQ